MRVGIADADTVDKQITRVHLAIWGARGGILGPHGGKDGDLTALE